MGGCMEGLHDQVMEPKDTSFVPHGCFQDIDTDSYICWITSFHGYCGVPLMAWTIISSGTWASPKMDWLKAKSAGKPWFLQRNLMVHLEETHGWVFSIKYNWLVVCLPPWKKGKSIGIIVPNKGKITNVPLHQPGNVGYYIPLFAYSRWCSPINATMIHHEFSMKMLHAWTFQYNLYPPTHGT